MEIFAKELRNKKFEVSDTGLYLPHSGVMIEGIWEHTLRRNGVEVDTVVEAPNLIVNTGLTYLLDVALSGGTQITSWYVGLLDTATSPAATWTMTEAHTNEAVAEYSEATREAYTDDGVTTSGTIYITNVSTGRATFTIASSVTVYGAFLSSSSDKSASTGTLFSAKHFGSSRALESGDELLVTYKVTASSSS